MRPGRRSRPSQSKATASSSAARLWYNIRPMSEELTPMQRQYRAIKRELPPGAILMFRLGDFYEMFGEDAVIASPILGATLTQRGGAPLCGIPYHALDAYLAKLIRAGKTAAICDQMEDPRLVKKGQVVRREVTRIVTPGTITEDGLLDAGTNTYIAAVSGLGLALLDLSTGEFSVEPFETKDRLDDALARLRPAEIVLPRPEDDAPPPAGVSYVDAWTFSFDAAQEEPQRAPARELGLPRARRGDDPPPRAPAR